jgi:hypothetical protein
MKTKVPPPRSEADSDDRILELHWAAVAGEHDAFDLLAAELMPRVYHHLLAHHPREDSQRLWDAVVDSWMHYQSKPLSFDPKRSISLCLHLVWAAKRNLTNCLQGERRRRRREQTFGLAQALSLELTQGSPGEVENEQQTGLIQLCKTRLSPEESACLDRMLDGEKRTKVFVRILRLERKDEGIQRKQVKRVKDRLRKRLIRLLAGASEFAAKENSIYLSQKGVRRGIYS